MPDNASRIKKLIEDAFAGVFLEDGVGLLEGQAIDDYAKPDVQATARSKDETEDWTQIPADQLNSAQSSLSFFDSKGMRFHLPAFLLAEIRGELAADIVFHLTYTDEEAFSRFSLLNPEQRESVHQFLLYHLETIPEPNRRLEKPMIEKAIEDFSSHGS
ncbi:MAG: hypothetical protein HUJ26_03940 [Planctomycetaceae bacterium]|nr:hypothetical protein [Planctomycetaceae bacterium]